MKNDLNIPLTSEDDDFDIYELTVQQKIEKGKEQNNIANGAMVPFPPNYGRLGLPNKLKEKLFRTAGNLAGCYHYPSEDGDILIEIRRYERDGKKEMRPIVHTGNGDFAIQGLQGWKPLYGLDKISGQRETTILIVEGEKTADAAGQMFPGMIASTFMGGVNGVHYVETYILEGRHVVLWPDNDPPGKAAMMAMAGYALRSGASSVRMVELPPELGEKWDLADPWPEALQGKVTPEDLIAAAVPVTMAEAEPYMRDRKAAALKSRLLGYNSGYTRVDIEQTKVALARLDPDMKKAPWAQIARAVYYAHGEAGLAIFDEWSSKGDKYRKSEPRALWGSFATERYFQAKTMAWLFRKASKAAKEAKDDKFAIDEVALAVAAIEELNHDHAVVQRGAKTVVMQEAFDPVQERYVAIFLQKQDFVAKFVQHVTLPAGDHQKPKKGKDTMQLGAYWFNSPWRRSYDGIMFAPGRVLRPGLLNSWTGFTVQPVDKPEGWAKFKRHLKDNVCGGSEDAYDYLLNWMAFAVQELDKKPGTAIVMVGPKGSGKTFVPAWIGRLFGHHTFMTAHDEDIVGRFNARLEDTLLLCLEEAVAPQSRKADSIIKDMITRDQLRLEDKFFSPWSAPNHLRIMMTSNNEHVVRADGYERRYAVYEVTSPFGDDADARRRYFGDIACEMENGGLAAMLGELLVRDIRNWNPEKLPKTAALQRQKQFTAIQDPVQAWYYDTLSDGLSITRYQIMGGSGAQWIQKSPFWCGSATSSMTSRAIVTVTASRITRSGSPSAWQGSCLPASRRKWSAIPTAPNPPMITSQGNIRLIRSRRCMRHAPCSLPKPG